RCAQAAPPSAERLRVRSLRPGCACRTSRAVARGPYSGPDASASRISPCRSFPREVGPRQRNASREPEANALSRRASRPMLSARLRSYRARVLCCRRVSGQTRLASYAVDAYQVRQGSRPVLSTRLRSDRSSRPVLSSVPVQAGLRGLGYHRLRSEPDPRQPPREKSPMRRRIPRTSLMLSLAAAAALTGAGAATQNGFDRLARESLARIDGTVEAPGLQADVQVLRDRWG